MSIKLTLPKKWVSGPAQRLVDTFVEAYNKKHAENELDESEMHFEKKDGFVIPFDAPVNSFMESGDELILKSGAGKSMEAVNYKPLFTPEDSSVSSSKAPSEGAAKKSQRRAA